MTNINLFSPVAEVPSVEDEREDRRVFVIRCRDNYTGPRPRYVPYYQTYFKDADHHLCNYGVRKWRRGRDHRRVANVIASTPTFHATGCSKQEQEKNRKLNVRLLCIPSPRVSPFRESRTLPIWHLQIHRSTNPDLYIYILAMKSFSPFPVAPQMPFSNVGGEEALMRVQRFS